MIYRSLFSILFLLSISCFGQQSGQDIQKTDSAEYFPRYLLGGTLLLNGEQALGEYLYLGSASISTGYLVTNHILLGTEFTASIAPTSRYYEWVPLARWYQNLGGHHRIYAGLRGGYGWGVDISVFNGSEKGRYAWLWGAQTGYLSMVSPNVGLDIFAFYNQRNSASQRQDGFFTSPAMTSKFGLGFGLQVFL